jgi:hypothetical protein
MWPKWTQVEHALAEVFKVINMKIAVNWYVYHIIKMFCRNLWYPFSALTMETSVISNLSPRHYNTPSP